MAVDFKDWRARVERRHQSWWPRGMPCDFGPGWTGLVERLFAAIDETLVSGPAEERAAFAISDVKEKYGSLRVYHNGGDAVDSLVADAEAESLRTCDRCGRPGVLRQGAWLSVRCDEHGEGWEAYP